MILTIHRGANEIGGSCVELASGNSKILIDLGMPLVNSNGGEFNFSEFKSLSADTLISLKILPPVPGLFDESAVNPVDGILISHAHLDHFGLSNRARKDTRFYIGEAALAIIELSNVFIGGGVKLNNPVIFTNSVKFRVGEFVITPYLTDHSAFDSYGFLIEAEGRKVFYTGDFRGHGRKSGAFQWFLKNAPRGVDLMLMEGTTVGRTAEKEPKTEKKIEEELTAAFSDHSRVNFVYCSGQNIDRLVSIFRACRKSGRKMVIDFYIAHVLKTLAAFGRLPFPGPNFPEIRVVFPQRLSRRFSTPDKQHYLFEFAKYKISREEISARPGDITMIVRPSMRQYIERLEGIDGGNFIYSMWSGYKTKNDTREFIDYLINTRKFNFLELHTSGHANLTALRQAVKAVAPRALVPIHTFSPKSYKELFDVPVIELNDGIQFEL